MRHLAAELIEIPGVVAVALGGSRATGTETVTSDWDFGLYYRGTIDTDEIRRLGWTGQVFEPGQWGRIVNGGAWLEVDGQRVDLIYRNLDDVEHWVAQSERGRFEIQREVGYVAGIATYVLTTAVQTGDPATVMCDEAERLGASMIVVGNRRVQTAGRVLGSVATNVARHATCDVLIVNTTAEALDDG